jgi:hypothetical protein
MKRSRPDYGGVSLHCKQYLSAFSLNGTDLNRQGLFLEETSTAGMPSSNLQGRTRGVFRKK